MNKRVEKIIKSVFKLDDKEIELSMTSDDIPGWDSIGHLNLVMEIEKEFDIKFEIEEMFNIQRLGDISDILKKKLKDCNID